MPIHLKRTDPIRADDITHFAQTRLWWEIQLLRDEMEGWPKKKLAGRCRNKFAAHMVKKMKEKGPIFEVIYCFDVLTTMRQAEQMLGRIMTDTAAVTARYHLDFTIHTGDMLGTLEFGEVRNFRRDKVMFCFQPRKEKPPSTR